VRGVKEITMNWPYSIIDVTVTEFCNMGCGYCYFGDKVAKNKMPRDVGHKIVDLVFQAPGQHMRRLNFFGGEPMAAWDRIQDMVMYAKTKELATKLPFAWGITTNMTLLEESQIPFFRETRGSVHCSIDGIPEIMDELRPHKNKNIKAADWIREKVKIALKITPQDTARITVTPHSVSKLFQNVAYCFSLGFQKTAPVPVFEAGWTEKDWGVLDQQMGLVCKWYIANIKQGASPYVKFIADSLTALKEPKQKRHFCGAGRNMIAVDMLGRITPCHRFSATHKHDMVSGNILEPDTWSFGTDYKDFLVDVRTLKENDQCRSCDARPICSSGCPSVNFEASGDLKLNTPEQCRFTKMAMKHAKLAWGDLAVAHGKNELPTAPRPVQFKATVEV
jgi:uncharacterized protein